MREHVARCLPEEACGLIAGIAETARTVIPVINRLHSTSRFEMNPVEQLKAFQWIDANQMELLAIYHSHPLGGERPSETDIQTYSYPGVAYVIWAYETDAWRVRGYNLDENDLGEIELDFPEQSCLTG